MTERLSPDYGFCMAASAVGPGLCLISAIWPETEDVIGFGLLGGGIGGAALVIGVAAVRRELRIRRRLAEIQPLPASPVLEVAQPAGEHEPTDAATRGVSMTKVA